MLHQNIIDNIIENYPSSHWRSQVYGLEADVNVLQLARKLLCLRLASEDDFTYIFLVLHSKASFKTKYLAMRLT